MVATDRPTDGRLAPATPFFPPSSHPHHPQLPEGFGWPSAALPQRVPAGLGPVLPPPPTRTRSQRGARRRLAGRGGRRRRRRRGGGRGTRGGGRTSRMRPAIGAEMRMAWQRKAKQSQPTSAERSSAPQPRTWASVVAVGGKEDMRGGSRPGGRRGLRGRRQEEGRRALPSSSSPSLQRRRRARARGRAGGPRTAGGPASERALGPAQSRLGRSVMRMAGVEMHDQRASLWQGSR